MTTKQDKAIVAGVTAAIVQDPVDRLGALLAKIAPDVEEIGKLKAQIKGRGIGKHEGALFTATVINSTKKTWIADKVKSYLTPQQLVHARKESPSISIEITAKQVA